MSLVHESGWFGGDAAVIESMRAHGMPTILDVERHLWAGNTLRTEADGARYEGIASSPVREAYAALGAEIVKLGGSHEAR